MNTNLPFQAAVFDMDGTLINNTPFHFKAWQQLFKRYNLPELSHETYLTEISGVPVANTVKQFFGGNADDTFIKRLAAEKQALYEEAFKPYLQPINGLENLLAELKGAGIRIAVATSSNMSDIDFIFDAIDITKYFDELITGGMVSQPKPSPQIFLKSAEKLGISAEKCIVFEDSLAGLKAGRNAGMKVAAITTSHSAEKLRKLADLVLTDYSELNLQKLAALFDDTQNER